MTVISLPVGDKKFDVPVNMSGVTRLTLGVFFIVMILVVLWSVFAELHVGAVAMGEVTPFGRSKTIQHLEGGIIREIRVRDGDAVKQGQELIILDDVEARAAVAISETERAARAALVERLTAERDGLPYKGTRPVGTAIQSQLRLFELRRPSTE